MSRSTGIFLSILFVIAVAFAAWDRQTPWFGPPTNAVDNRENEESMADVIAPPNAPDDEIVPDAYENLTRYAKAYPQLRPMIRKALADGKVTNAEYNQIDQAEEPLALKQGAIDQHNFAAPWRKKLAEAVGATK